MCDLQMSMRAIPPDPGGRVDERCPFYARCGAGAVGKDPGWRVDDRCRFSARSWQRWGPTLYQAELLSHADVLLGEQAGPVIGDQLENRQMDRRRPSLDGVPTQKKTTLC